MTQSKHTPGPWIPEFGEAYRVRAQQDGGQVAIMMNLKGRHGLAGRRTGDEVAANARLIAAAPDLKNVADSFQISGPDSDGFIWLVLHGNGATGKKAMFNLGTEGGIAATVALLLDKERRAAIAKATGATND